MIHQCLVYIFVKRSKHSTSLTFLSVKMALAAPKIMCPGIYTIFTNEITYTHSVKGNDKHAKGRV